MFDAYMRTLSFYAEGYYLLGTVVMPLKSARAHAQRLLDQKTKYIDVLDEGILVARVQHKIRESPGKY